MGTSIKIKPSEDLECVRADKNEVVIAERLLSDARNAIECKSTIRVPIAELSTLGTTISSLIPALNTVTQTTTLTEKGLYRLANVGPNDTLKVAKNGNSWGVFNTAEGASKLVQLQGAEPISITTAATTINPVAMMMAVALFSIEKELDAITEMEKQILYFLEIEKESEIEADVETLLNLITKYKYNWDNELFVKDNHQMVLNIQRTARKNMNLYHKKIKTLITSKQYIIAQTKIESLLSDIEKNFKYYRISLYTFSLASLIEIMLSNNFKEEYINGIIDEIQEMSKAYRELFRESSIFLEHMGNLVLEANVLKGIGTAGKAVGKVIANIPFIKEGQIDEFLQESGTHLQDNAVGIEQKAVKELAALSNPSTRVLVDRMKELIQIYNHTSQICFDKEMIYLVMN